MIRVTNGFDRLTDADLAFTADSIVSKMTNNTAFPTPTPTLVVIKGGIENYHISLVDSLTGDKTAVAIKNTRKAELIALLRLLANYVNFAGNGDRDVLVSSGFNVSKAATPVPPLTKPASVELVNGLNSGELAMSFKRVPGARSYQFESTPDPLLPASNWQVQTGTLVRHLFTGLDSGKRYWCRVAVVGNNNQLVYSDPVSRVTQ